MPLHQRDRALSLRVLFQNGITCTFVPRQADLLLLFVFLESTPFSKIVLIALIFTHAFLIRVATDLASLLPCMHRGLSC